MAGESLFSFSLSIKSAFTHGSFSVIESTLRWVAQASHLETGLSFRAVYTALLADDVLSAPPPERKELLQLLSRIRNTVHNSGVNINYSQQDEEVEYKGERFVFKHNNPVDVADWHQMIGYISDAVDLIDHVVFDPVVAEIERIEDPSASPPWLPEWDPGSSS
jgi:hypothetical protein